MYKRPPIFKANFFVKKGLLHIGKSSKYGLFDAKIVNYSTTCCPGCSKHFRNNNTLTLWPV